MNYDLAPISDRILVHKRFNCFIVISLITDEANPMRALEMLFFALFGLTRPEDLQMTKKVDSWVESWVKLIMATYLLLTGIVLINLLIAMMSDTYQRISVMERLQIKAYVLRVIIVIHIIPKQHIKFLFVARIRC